MTAPDKNNRFAIPLQIPTTWTPRASLRGVRAHRRASRRNLALLCTPASGRVPRATQSPSRVAAGAY
jgi:hypothetical protein